MPHLNRFPSSPSLRDSPKQALDELAHYRSSIPHPKSASLRSSVRSFSTRRPRPSVASIADIFVGSLVLAGFCHEHSPPSRGLYTSPLNSSGHQFRRFRGNGMAGHGRPAIRRPLDWTGSVPSARSRSWLSHGLARTEDYRIQHDTSTEQRKENDDHKATGSSKVENGHFQDEFPNSYLKSESRSEPEILNPANEAGTTTEVIEEGEETPKIRYHERDRIDVMSIFQLFVGDYPDWEDAVDDILPKDLFGETQDNTPDAIEIPSVAALLEALPRSKSWNATPQFLFRLYRDLPSPGVAYLSKASRGVLLRRLASPDKRRLVDGRRYLALVDDMIAANLSMNRAMWTTAIYMAGRSNSGRVSKRRLIRAIGLWQQMEHLAGIKADNVVFNILFNIAIKSGNYIVADRLEDEMERRGIRFSREGLVSKIFAHGTRGDVEGIRETFDLLVQSGELVDTVILNCMIASSLRAGDRATAEEIYTQMLEAQKAAVKNDSAKSKALENASALSSDLDTYRRGSKSVGRLLKRSQKLKWRHPKMHSILQNSIPMTPDTRTFYIMLQHSARVNGRFIQFLDILRDMETTYAVPPRHMIYLLLFEGFSLFGRSKKRHWSTERLRLTWMAFLRALRESSIRVKDVHSKAPALWENPFESLEVGTEDFLGHTSKITDTDALYVSSLSTHSGEKVEAPELDKNATGEVAEKNKSIIIQTMSLEDIDTKCESAIAEIRSEYASAVENKSDVDNKSDGQPMGSEDYTSYGWDTLPTSAEALAADVDENTSLKRPEGRIEDGLFLGPRIIIVILQAFGTCYGPQEVMEVWLQLDALWPPSKRKAIDVLGIQEVLQEQMARSPPQWRVKYEEKDRTQE